MKSPLPLILTIAIATLASAQLDALPKCAGPCFTKATASGACDPTDVHCQCTTGAAAFMKIAVPCICEAGCSDDDLKKIETATNNLCMAALEAKGEAYTPSTLDPKVCQAVETKMGASSLTSITGTATATESVSATETAAAPTSSPAPTGGAQANRFILEAVVVGLVVVGLVLM